MEEASGVDLDWFWRGWFYSTDHTDIALDRIYKLRLDTEDPDTDSARAREEFLKAPTSLTDFRNKEEDVTPRIKRKVGLEDFYNKYDRFTVTNKQRNKYQSFLDDLEVWERAVLERAVKEDENYYVLQFSNLGGLVMPIILEVTYEDNSKEEIRIPAEIWRRNPEQVAKLLITEKEITKVVVDPRLETADVNLENNTYPPQIIQSRIEAYKSSGGGNLPNRDLMEDIKSKIKRPDTDDE